MVDVLETMLRGVQAALDRGDRREMAETKRLDDVLDRLNSAIKDYVAGLDTDDLSDADNRRLMEILTFATNMEYAGDVIDRNVIGLASKRLKRGLTFTPEARADIDDALHRLDRNLRAAAAVFMTADPRAARSLAAEKVAFRDMEAQATEAHFMHLRDARAEAMEPSALHLDLLRDLKRINAHFVAAAANPVLQEAGELRPSRLRDEDA
jgi:phosphate:Na+ symporter